MVLFRKMLLPPLSSASVLSFFVYMSSLHSSSYVSHGHYGYVAADSECEFASSSIPSSSTSTNFLTSLTQMTKSMLNSLYQFAWNYVKTQYYDKFVEYREFWLSLPLPYQIVAAGLGLLFTAYMCLYYYHRRKSSGFIYGDEAGALVAKEDNIPTIHGIFLFKGKSFSGDDLIENIKSRGVPETKYHRLAYRVANSYDKESTKNRTNVFNPKTDWPAYYVKDEEFDFKNHVWEIDIKECMQEIIENSTTDEGVNNVKISETEKQELLSFKNWGHESLLKYMGYKINHPPSLERPPWEILICKNWEGVPEDQALFVRFHHVIADGLALVSFLDTITNPPDNVDPTQSSLSQAGKVGLKHKGNEFPWWVRLILEIRFFFEFPLVMLFQYVLVFPDRNFYRSNNMNGRKKTGWFKDYMDMDRVKKIKNHYKVTVNDLMISCASASLHRIGEKYQHLSKYPPVKQMKIFSPISVRMNLEECEELNNKLAVLMLPLPTSTNDKNKRLNGISKMLKGKKTSIVPWGMARVIPPMGFMPKNIFLAFNEFMYNKVSAVLTNVPGPIYKRNMCGATMSNVMFWVPGLGQIGLVFCIFSYGNYLNMGVVCDHAIPVEPNEFMQEFFHELEEYEKGMMITKEVEGTTTNGMAVPSH